MKKLLIGLFLITLSAQWSFAQNITTEQEVTQLSKDKWQWMADKNADTLAHLFHDQAKFVHMGGTWGKDREVEIIRSGGIHYGVLCTLRKKALVYKQCIYKAGIFSLYSGTSISPS